MRCFYVCMWTIYGTWKLGCAVSDLTKRWNFSFASAQHILRWLAQRYAVFVLSDRTDQIQLQAIFLDI